jgi:rhodanese-related sulfurtransferase
MVTPIARTELQAKLDGPTPPVLVEALPAGSYESGHLPGARNLPHDRVDELAPSVLPDKDAEVVVYCANGPCHNSGIAARRLEQLGYRHVYDYELGKQDWVEAGLPLETGQPATA